MRTGAWSAVCAALCVLAAWPALAGDEVDYSAPYLVVEDGKLVTKYPGREHEAGVDATATVAEAAGEEASPAAVDRNWKYAAAGSAALVLLLFGLLRLRRRRAADS